MARQLLIGNGGSVGYTNGVLAANAVDVQKLSASGPTSMVIGDTIADSEQFRIVQGDGTKNIVSPWIYGRDVINWGGISGVAQAAEVKNAALTTNASAAGTHTLKIINTTNGVEPFEMKSYEITVTAAMTPTAQTALLKTAIDADLPHWVNGAVTDNNGDIDVTGFKKGEVKANGSVQDELVSMRFVWEAEGTTLADSSTTVGSRGFGDGFYVQEFESNLMGTNYGYYNRIQQPIAPAATAVTGTTYDMYSIVATKDGSSASQIHGVDNLIEISVAMPIGDADGVVFENTLNGYLASFAPVTL